MNRYRIQLSLFVLISVVGILPLAGCSDSNKEQSVKATATSIAAGYDALASAAAKLDSKAGAFCAAPDAAGLSESRAAWNASMDAWMRIQPINFGPIRELDMAYKIQFWPDPRDMVGAEVQAQVEAAEKAGATNGLESKIESASVAAHGLPAIEALLYPDEGDSLDLLSNPSRCSVLTAITSTLASGTGQLAQAWAIDGGGYAHELGDYGDGSAPFADADAALSAILGSLIQTLESIEGSKLGWPLGVRANGKPQPFRVESRRSMRSLENIQANLGGVASIFSGADAYGLDDYLRSLSGGGELADAFTQQLQLAQQQADAAPPLFSALQGGADLDAYHELLKTVRAATHTLGDQIAKKLGVSGGLNFNDGD